MAGKLAQERTAQAIANLGTDPLQLDIDLLLRGGGGGGTSLPLATSSSPRLSQPSRFAATSRSQDDAARPSAGGIGAAAGAAAPAATDALGIVPPTPPPVQDGRPTALLQGAQAEAGRKALALNLKLQAALRKELQGLDETLQRNREVSILRQDCRRRCQ